MRVTIDPRQGVARSDERVVALSSQELSVLAAFATAGDRVVGRVELQRLAGLAQRGPRRCDSVLVGVRRAIGSDAIVTVRGRGWRCLADVVTLQAS